MTAQRVLIVNKFYRHRGGDCIHALALEDMLLSHGHEVAVMSTAHPSNDQPSAWSGYWPAAVDFGSARLRSARRMLGLDGTARDMRRIIRDFRPDVVHLHNIHSHLSPVVAREAHKAGCRVVWTLHDYKLICPSYTLICRGRQCVDCVKATPWPVVRKRCFRGSAMASVAAWAEAVRWDAGKLQQWTDAFVCPSDFMRRLMMYGGYDRSKLHVMHNFFTSSESVGASAGGTKEPYYCYVGRISPEKGVATLLEAASRLPYRLKVAGDGPLSGEFRQRYGSFSQIEWLGNLDAPSVGRLLRGARFSVVPSEWPENCPLSVIESLCEGTPVVATGTGGITELLEGESDLGNALLLDDFDAGPLADCIEAMWHVEHTPDHRDNLMRRSRLRFSPEIYYRMLMEVYSPSAA